MEFKDKVVIITGAAGGIGKATVKKFKESGAKITLVDLSATDLATIVNDLGLDEDKYLVVTANVSKENQVENYVEKTIEKFGRVDIFINNAGIEGKIQPIVETTEENLDLVLNVNIKGVYFGLKHVLPIMYQQNSGVVVNTASVAGFVGSPGLGSYVASKHAVLGITKTAALESAAQGVRVNAVCPGPVDNRMMESIEDGIVPGHGSNVRDEFKKSIPIGRYSTNEEVANLIYYLASDNAQGITGTAYKIDGGMTAS